MLLLLVGHLAMALAAPALVGWLGRRAFLVLALAPASAAVWALSQTSVVQHGTASGAVPTEVVEWVPALHLELAFRLDTLSWLMLLIVGGVGALVLVYCSAYFSASAFGLGRFGAALVAFAGSMVGLVTTDNTLMLYVFWELTTVFSYLLIGHYADRKASRRGAMQAIIITTAGGLAMLVGVIVLGRVAGTFRLSELVAHPPSGTAVTVAVVLILAGAVSKSALVPLHFWLPAAMAAPTPVSAYLHAAAMVKAGIYLIARLAPGYSGLVPWQVVVLTLGSGTFLLGGYRALRQHDLKLILAFGTVSQLGFLVLLVGLGTRAAALAGLAMLGAHAMFKAALFLVVGVVDAATGTRDMRRLSGVGRELPITALAGVLATASMIGLPPFAGYVAKEAALEAVRHDASGWRGGFLVGVVAVGSALTVAYGLRLLWGAFATKRRVIPAPPAADLLHPRSSIADAAAVGSTEAPAGRSAVVARPPGHSAHTRPPPITHPSLLLVWPALTLAVLGLAVALVPGFGSDLLSPYANTYPTGEAAHLTLWAGVTPTLAITVVVLTVGLVLFALRGPVEVWQADRHVSLEADRVYRRMMRRLDEVAADVTAVTQRGSLPLYLGLILAVFVVAAGGTAIAGTSWPTSVRVWDRPAQLALGAVTIGAAILAARARRRLKAVILLGTSGYGVAALFLLHGAPDLALTQVLSETITLVVFVLVLRRLPPYFSDRPLAASRWVRLAVGLAAGLTVAGLALVVPGARIHPPVSAGFAAEAVTYGGGTNIVNVTLVDIRAWDTLGEISVLLVAATGVASLVFLRRRTSPIFRAGEATPHGRPVWGDLPDPGGALRRHGTIDAPASAVPSPADPTRRLRSAVWLRAVPTLAPQRRSVIFEVVTRLLFHTMILYSVYLLVSGHNAPGGGFAAGLVTSIALIVRYLAGGRYELGEAAPIQPGLLLGGGLFLAAGVGIVGLLAGGSALQSVIVDLHVPVVGKVHLVTSVFFDLGVYLVVVGLVLDILRSLGAEVDRQVEAEAGPSPAGPAGPAGSTGPTPPTSTTADRGARTTGAAR